MKVSFITWYPSCRRSDALAQAFGGVSHLIHYLEFKQPLYAPFKYVLQTGATLRRLWRDRPELILVASPPVFAVAAVWCYARLFHVPYVVDAHTGVFDDPRWRWLAPLSRFFSRGAIATVVTNVYLKRQVEEWGARGLIIGDVPVDFAGVKPAALGAGFHVVVINTYSQDEPLDEILAAAQRLPDCQFHVTGNPRHARNNLSETVPANVRLTGWLSEENYAGLLLAADVIVCLTTHNHTMQRGGYEAMALEKPLITSNWDLLRETFSAGTIHVDNTATEIARAIARVMNEQRELAAGMGRLRRERRQIFLTNLGALRNLLTGRNAAA